MVRQVFSHEPPNLWHEGAVVKRGLIGQFRLSGKGFADRSQDKAMRADFHVLKLTSFGKKVPRFVIKTDIPGEAVAFVKKGNLNSFASPFRQLDR